jgi:hypothetical protein
MENNGTLHSYHIFLFPFKWEKKGGIPDETLEEKFKVDGFETELFNNYEDNNQRIAGSKAENLKFSGWFRRTFDIDRTDQYNEFNYFYDFVREVLYDLGDSSLNQSQSNLVFRHYEYGFKGRDKPKFCIQVDKKIKENKGKDFVFELDLEDITLNIYNTGVGVLSFFLANRAYTDPKDVILINQFGRRIFPPFYDLDAKKIGANSRFASRFEQALQRTQEKELAKAVFLSFSDEKADAKFKEPYPKAEDAFKDYKKDKNEEVFNPIEHPPFHLPRYIEDLFGESIGVDKKASINIQPVLDDRMFVICWYGNNELARQITQFHPETREYQFSYHDWWYKYVFIDPTFPSCQNQLMRKELSDQHTYGRWVDYNTIYGISRYSLVCLTATLDSLKQPKVNAAFLVQHMQSIYYKMAELVLVQRASMLRFADEVTHLSTLKSGDPNLSKKINDLYRSYIQFVNKIFFREVTAQDQGIEMYQMLQENINIEQNVKDLDQEIEELHKYAMLEEENRRSDAAEKTNRLIALIGIVLFVPSFITGFFGMNSFGEQLRGNNSEYVVIILVLVLFFSLTGYGLIRHWLSIKEKKWWETFLMAVVSIIWIAFFLGTLAFPLLFENLELNWF